MKPKKRKASDYNLDHTICYEFDGLSKINKMIEKLSPLSDIPYVLDDQNEESVNSSVDSYYYNQYYTDHTRLSRSLLDNLADFIFT